MPQRVRKSQRSFAVLMTARFRGTLVGFGARVRHTGVDKKTRGEGAADTSGDEGAVARVLGMNMN